MHNAEYINIGGNLINTETGTTYEDDIRKQMAMEMADAMADDPGQVPYEETLSEEDFADYVSGIKF